MPGIGPGPSPLIMLHIMHMKDISVNAERYLIHTASKLIGTIRSLSGKQ